MYNFIIIQAREKANPEVSTGHPNRRESHHLDIEILILQKDKDILKVLSDLLFMTQEEELLFLKLTSEIPTDINIEPNIS